MFYKFGMEQKLRDCLFSIYRVFIYTFKDHSYMNS